MFLRFYYWLADIFHDDAEEFCSPDYEAPNEKNPPTN